MSDTTETAVRRLRQDSPIVDAVCRQLERQVDASEAAWWSSFAEIFFSKALPGVPPRAQHRRAGPHRRWARSASSSGRRPDRVERRGRQPRHRQRGVVRPGDGHPHRRLGAALHRRHHPRVPPLPGARHRAHTSIRCSTWSGATTAARRRPPLPGGARGGSRWCTARSPRSPTPTALELAPHRVGPPPPGRGAGHRRLRRDGGRGEPASWPRWPSAAGSFPTRRPRWRRPRRSSAGCGTGPSSSSGTGRTTWWSWRGSGASGGARLGARHPRERGRVVATRSRYRSERPGAGAPRSWWRAARSSSSARPTRCRRCTGGSRMDYIGVKKLGRGRAASWASTASSACSPPSAYAEDAEKIPILRQKLDRSSTTAGVRRGIARLQGDHHDLQLHAEGGALPHLGGGDRQGHPHRPHTYHTDEVRVTLREDPLHRGVSAMVILPKDRFSGEARKSIEGALIEAFQGEVLNYHLALGEGDQARLHFYLAVPPERLRAVKAEQLESVVGELIRSWRDRVRERLERVRPPDEARRLARRYSEAFSPEYQAATAPRVAVHGHPRARGHAGRGAPGLHRVLQPGRRSRRLGGGAGHRAEAVPAGRAAGPLGLHAHPGELRDSGSSR